MSGAVDTTKKVLEVAAFPVVAPAKAAFELAKDGKNPFKSLGESARNAVGTTVGAFMEGVKGPEHPLNIADPIDPAVEAEKTKKERQRVKRQAEIDILTDRPGRGGTILTDQFTYNV